MAGSDLERRAPPIWNGATTCGAGGRQVAGRSGYTLRRISTDTPTFTVAVNLAYGEGCSGSVPTGASTSTRRIIPSGMASTWSRLSPSTD